MKGQSVKNVAENQFKINFINPGIEYEFAVGNDATLDFGAGLQFVAAGSGANFYYAFIPALNAQYRYYYNMERRLEKNKRIEGNTGNYLALSGNLFTADVIIGNVESGTGTAGFVGPIYGIQRTYPKGFNFGMEFGAGVYFQSDQNFRSIDSGFAPIISFSIGWVLGMNK